MDLYFPPESLSAEYKRSPVRDLMGNQGNNETTGAILFICFLHNLPTCKYWRPVKTIYPKQELTELKPQAANGRSPKSYDTCHLVDGRIMQERLSEIFLGESVTDQ